MRFPFRPAALVAAALLCCVPGARGAGVPHAWGYNHKGQLGDGGAEDRPAAAPVAGLPAGVSAVDAAAGFWHSLAAGSDGRVYAWGYNYFGQLGDGGTVDRPRPAPTAPLPEGVSATAVAAGLGHSLALGSDGAVYAWGDNASGQLGNGRLAGLTPQRVTLPTGAPAVAVAAGDIHSLAVDALGLVYAWGDNEYGQLGDGGGFSQPVPTLVEGLIGRKVVAVAAGGRHSLALDETGAVHAWGYNGYGQLGDGGYRNQPTPVPVKGLPAGVAVRGVAAGKYHSLALGSDGRVYAWGSNDSGELGDGTAGVFAYRTEPMPVTGFPEGVSVTAVGAGDYFSLAAGSDGRAYAWGYNYNGQLGDGTSTSRKNPVPILGLPDGVPVRRLDGGGFHGIALAALPAPVLDAARVLRILGGLEPATPRDLEAAAVPPQRGLHIMDAVRLLRESPAA